MSYKGKLLVAHPNLKEGIFARSVILIYQDDPQNGTLGLMLNKPTTWKLRTLLEEKNMSYEGSEYIYKGGPVNENAIIMLHEDNWYCSNTTQVGNGLAMTSDILMMEKLSMQNKPVTWRMFAGMCGWAPSQLIRELSSPNGWLTCDINDSIVFDKDGERQWNSAVQMCATQKIDSYF